MRYTLAPIRHKPLGHSQHECLQRLLELTSFTIDTYAPRPHRLKRVALIHRSFHQWLPARREKA